MSKNKFVHDYQYDWVKTRSTRLESALKTIEKPPSIKLPVSTIEPIQQMTESTKFHHVLPFFSIIQRTANYIGRSKISNESPSNSPISTFNNNEQTMFLLDKRRTLFSPQVPIEFEIIN